MPFKFTGRFNKLMVMLETTKQRKIILLDYNDFFTISRP